MLVMWCAWVRAPSKAPVVSLSKKLYPYCLVQVGSRSPTRSLILRILGIKQHLPCQWIHKSSFLEQIMGNIPEIIHFETGA